RRRPPVAREARGGRARPRRRLLDLRRGGEDARGVRRAGPRKGAGVKSVVAAVLLLALLGDASGEELQRLPVVLHVHSDLSTGELSLDELARQARAQQLGGLLLVENYLLRAEYGLAPFRALTRVTHEQRGVLTSGLETYLARVDRARRAHPELVIVPGVEVIPH